MFKRALCWFLMHRWQPMPPREIDRLFHQQGMVVMVHCARCGAWR